MLNISNFFKYFDEFYLVFFEFLLIYCLGIVGLVSKHAIETLIVVQPRLKMPL